MSKWTSSKYASIRVSEWKLSLREKAAFARNSSLQGFECSGIQNKIGEHSRRIRYLSRTQVFGSIKASSLLSPSVIKGRMPAEEKANGEGKYTGVDQSSGR